MLICKCISASSHPFEALHSARAQFYDGVERDGQVWRVGPAVAHVEGVDDAQDALVRHDQQRLLVALHLHDDGLKTRNHVQIALSAGIPGARDGIGWGTRGGGAAGGRGWEGYKMNHRTKAFR